ncbi:MAG: coproporphyrinogen dehydrogenase HemZ [Lachnospiraceae bacterium]|nr:coproporphyrinogen dehydrogenase HemZ [Lachnospiraceae bacterium]
MKLLLNAPLFEYDIRGLLMAFYPWQKFETDPGAEDPMGLSVYFTGDTDAAKGRGNVPVRLTADLSLWDDGEGYRISETVSLDLSDKSAAKTLLKRTLYGMLSGKTGRTLPWGTLTGIRPTKIATAMLEAGASDGEILRHMEGDLMCSHEKALLSAAISKRERALIAGTDGQDGYSIYVGIPFCPTRCLYCSFTAYPVAAYRDRLQQYLDAVEQELLLIRDLFRGKKLNTVYFGGGTPTALDAPDLDRLLGFVEDHFDLSDLREWTVEAGRPDSVTPGKLDALKAHPVSRISVNPQTMHQKTLDLIGRKHTVEQVVETYRLAREKGFDNINMDLILGLPGENESDVRETLRRVSALDPESVTVHSLAVKRASRLNLMKEQYREMPMENSEALMRLCVETLRERGCAPYYLYRQKNMAGNLENVGFAKPGKEGLYNILIMEEVQSIAAAGAGATSKCVRRDLITRAENAKDIRTYLEHFDEMLARKRALYEDRAPGEPPGSGG